MELINISRIVTTTMKVANLLGGIKVIIGLDLFGLLGYELKNVPILFPKNVPLSIFVFFKIFVDPLNVC